MAFARGVVAWLDTRAELSREHLYLQLLLIPRAATSPQRRLLRDGMLWWPSPTEHRGGVSSLPNWCSGNQKKWLGG